MIGKLFGAAIKIATLPIDAANIGADILIGGDGSKRSRKDNLILGDLELLRDRITQTIEEIDED